MSEIASGQVVSLHYFGRRLICYRGFGFARDFYRDRPQLARSEGAITEFRARARQSCEEAFA
jgi:hypothetical protein